MRGAIERQRRRRAGGLDVDAIGARRRRRVAQQRGGIDAARGVTRFARTKLSRSSTRRSSRRDLATPRARPCRARRPAVEALDEELRVALERRERVADLVREHRRHLAERDQAAIALGGGLEPLGAARQAPEDDGGDRQRQHA